MEQNARKEAKFDFDSLSLTGIGLLEDAELETSSLSSRVE